MNCNLLNIIRAESSIRKYNHNGFNVYSRLYAVPINGTYMYAFTRVSYLLVSLVFYRNQYSVITRY